MGHYEETDASRYLSARSCHVLHKQRKVVLVMLKPLGARAIVKPLEAEEKSAGGIILPETAQERPREGRVVAVGTAGLYVEDSDEGESVVKEGDIVVYASFGGTEVKIDGEEYLIISEDDILAMREE